MLKQLNEKMLGDESYYKIGLLFENNDVFERVKKELNSYEHNIYFDSIDQELGKYVVFFINKEYYNETMKIVNSVH